MPLEIFETLSTSDAVIFLTSKALLQNHDRLPSFSSLKKAVVDDNDIYVIDFSDTVGIKYESEVQKIVQKKLAVSFKCDLLIITKFKNKVMFTPIEDKHSLDDGNMTSVRDLQEHLKVLSENKIKKADLPIRKNTRSLKTYVCVGGGGLWTETYSEPGQASKMEHFAKLVNGSILDVWQGPEYAFGLWVRVAAPVMLKDVKEDDDQTVPNIAFYMNIQHQIPSSKSTFYNSTLWHEKGERNFCSNPHISLIFQVNLQRSLSYGTSGGSTPDSKIVRICADENTGGAGIHLNDSLSWKEYGAPYVTLDAYFKEWSSSAIAKDYTVNIKASSGKASVLKTCPANNVNHEYSFNDTSGFTLGITGGLEADKEGPKAKLEASAAYTQSRSISFETHDYKMERFTDGPQNIRFTFSREQYPVASSLLNRSTDAVWADIFPADLGRVHAMGYASFVPKLDVVYSASPNETGTTEFSVEASVQIMPIYHGAYKHYYVVGGHQSYHGSGFDMEGNRALTTQTFTVDWEHPVFTGGRPVNLQSSAYPDKCIEVDSSGNITLKTGDISSAAQSFIYDNIGRYVSTTNLNMCLDGSNLNKLQPCSTSLTQRWEWQEGTNYLINVYSNKKLGVDTATGMLGLFDGNSGTVNTNLITAFTELFSAGVI